MPQGKLWYLEKEGASIYLVLGKSRSKYGAIKTMKKPSSGEENLLKVIFQSVGDRSGNTKLLNVKNFSWNSNDFSSQFQNSRTPENFIAKFSQLMTSNLSCMEQDDHGIDSNSETFTADNQLSGDQPPPKKRSKVLLPVSCRDDHDIPGPPDDDDYDEKRMDKEIESHFQGYLMLPVKCLKEPPKELLIRECNKTVVESLKKEIIDNPCSDVTPILCIAEIEAGSTFQQNLKEAYTYLTIGGNHSRQAFQELLDDDKELVSKRLYSHRLCSVYSPMSRQLTSRLAFKHNRATAFSHKMTSWDWILQSRKLLYEMCNKNEADETPVSKPEGWKKACATIISLKVSQLEERMIYFLASLPMKSFDVLKNIYQAHSKGKLKGQVISRSEKGIDSIIDLKGSSFKPFRGLDSDTLYQLLTDIDNKKCTFKEAAGKCSEIKTLQKIQAAFIKFTNCEDWDEAVTKYPDFATVQRLEPFKKLDFTTSKKIPDKFLKFRQQAKEMSSVADGNREQDGYFSITHNGFLGIVWKQNLLELMPQALSILNCSCKGLNLVILDLLCSDKVAEDAKQFSYIIRAINYHMGLQEFTIIFISNLESMLDVAATIKADKVQVAICGVTPARRTGSSRLPTQLDEIALGVVVGRSGQILPLSKPHDNMMKMLVMI